MLRFWKRSTAPFYEKLKRAIAMNSTPSLTAETEIARQFYAAINRGDIPAAIAPCDPQIEWRDPDGSTYRGLEAVREHFQRARATWAEGSCQPVRFFAAGDKVVVFVDVHVRLQEETEWRSGPLGDVFTFRDGKITAVRCIPDRDQALAFARVPADAAD